MYGYESPKDAGRRPKLGKSERLMATLNDQGSHRLGVSEIELHGRQFGQTHLACMGFSVPLLAHH